MMEAEGWKTIPDDKVRHIWRDPENHENEFAISPEWYENNGTPMVDDRDCEYVRTEILE